LNFDTINQNKDTVIALAYSSDNPNQNPSGYMFLCMLQLENKLQQGAREIIEQLSKNGIRSILLTGDKAETALRVGTDCGITEKLSACLTGRMIDRMELSEVAKQSSYCSVFARLLPSQKGTIIRLLQQKGHYVAMGGDGPNDGIALKVADIGISFAKDSSPIARRLAKILINNLDDLLKLFECASRFRKGYNRLRILRTIVLVVSLLSIYAWILEYIVG
jgi:Ca2+-transporting ATPase